ncbi:flagellar protein export ATPase FliI [Tuberibacillus sp. Marseille-P3662]|uniref:flagellar protein export ATPase FliI n=1 Tax=Tuberibacillus sp. Marseille-P3662 TaxID=1965358 RepID=UPI000A1C97D8|nr:flagellar protein export ATPase FliI [Tuberibacillus sp. Marseille-P3662]
MKTAIDCIDQIDRMDPFNRYGRITRVVGMLIESKGPPASTGDLCYIHIPETGAKIRAEVVGFHDEHLLLMPYAKTDGIASGSWVESTGRPLAIDIGTALIGKVLNSIGQPWLSTDDVSGLVPFSTDRQPPNPLERPAITEPLSVGVRSIDGLLTIGKGQRVGIFAGSGVGKSTLMGMIAKNTTADINVIALVGERGREVREFVENELGDTGLKRSIIVAATSDESPLSRIRGALTATAIAEYFRDQGMDVMLMMDSLTRVAMAQREIGLATGEPPTTKGYPPSVFALMPQLLERAGTDSNGSITAFYTVLVDGDDLDEPIADTARGILDGHIVLDRDIAEQGRYPAINVLKSISRLMTKIVPAEQQQAAQNLRRRLAKYVESEDLINIGAYQKGSSPEVDQAIAFYPKIQSFLQQDHLDAISFSEAVKELTDVFGGD